MSVSHMAAYAVTRNLHPSRAGSAAPRPKYGDDLFAGTNYPRRWEDYVGQQMAKAQLRGAIHSAKVQGRRMDHVLISSPLAGIGKTALALLVAADLGVGVLEVSGRMSLKDLQAALRGLKDGDVLFSDEVHRWADGGRKNAEPLLHLLQDGVVMTPTGPVEVPDITVIGATTDKQKLDTTITDRFLVQVQLAQYTEDEAVTIAAGHARRLGFGVEPLPWGPDDEWLRDVARAGVCNPRVMVKVLTALRDYSISCVPSEHVRPGFVSPSLPLNERSYDMTVPLAWLGLTPDGLDATAQAYLVTLAAVFSGVAGERAIATALGERGGVRHSEQALLQKGLIIPTGQGRQLTEDGWARAAQLMEGEA